MATIASMAVSLTADTSRFVRQMEKSRRESRRMERALQDATRNLESMQRWGRRAAIAVGALSAALAVGIRRSSQYAREIRRIAEQTGLATDSVQALAFAAGESNVEFAQLQTAMRGFVRRAAEAARGNNQFLRGFERLGFTQQQVAEGLDDIEGLLVQVADRMSQMESAADQSAVAMLLMSDAGRQMIPLLRRGGDGIEALMNQAVDLGIVLDERLIRGFDLVGREMDTTGTRFRTVGQEILAQFIPAALVVNRWLNEGLDWWRELDGELRSQVVRWSAIVGAILGTIAVLGVLAGALRATIMVFQMVGLAKAVALLAPFALFIAKTTLVIAALEGLRRAWESDFLGIRTAAENAWERIEPILLAIGEGVDAVWFWTLDVASDLWDWVKGTVPAIGDAISTAWEWTLDRATDLGAWITDTVGTIGDGVSTTWDWALGQAQAVENWLIRNWEPIGTAATTVWQWLLGQTRTVATWLDDTWDAIGDAVSTAWNWTLGQTRAVADWLADTWDAIGSTVTTVWSWSLGRVDEFIRWIRDTAAPWLGGQVDTVWDWTAHGLDAISNAIESIRDWSEGIRDIWQQIMEWWREFAGGQAEAAGRDVTSVPAAAPRIHTAPLAELDDATMDLFARLVTAEAAMEGFEGQVGVAAVVLNRVLSDEFPDSVREVIKQHNAFQPVMEGTIEQVKATEEAFRAVADALRGVDPTQGATFFWNPDIATSGWFRRAVESGNLQLTTRIGQHEFFSPTPGFRSGTPFTGHGPLDEVAGVVHRREAVIPWPVLRGGPAAVLDFLGMPGFQGGRRPNTVPPSNIGPQSGFFRQQFEELLLLLRRHLGDEHAGTIEALRSAFENLLNITDNLEARFDELWSSVGNWEEELQAAVDGAGDFRDTLSEWEADIERQQRVQQRWQSGIDAFAQGLDTGSAALDRFTSELLSGALMPGRGFGGLLDFGINLIGGLIGSLFAAPGHAPREPREFAAPDPITDPGGLATALQSRAELQDELPGLEANLRRAEQLLERDDTWIHRLINPDLIARRQDAVQVARRELENALRAVEGFELRDFLGVDPASIARAVESGFDMADPSRLGAGLENMVQDALVRAWTTSAQMLDLQETFGDELEEAMQRFIETGELQADALDPLRATIALIEAQGEGFADLLRELGFTVDDVNQSMRTVNRNLPTGFRADAFTFSAAGVAQVQGANAGGQSGASVTFQPGSVVIQGSDNPVEQWRKLKRVMEREGVQFRGTPVEAGQPLSTS